MTTTRTLEESIFSMSDKLERRAKGKAKPESQAVAEASKEKPAETAPVRKGNAKLAPLSQYLEDIAHDESAPAPTASMLAAADAAVPDATDAAIEGMMGGTASQSSDAGHDAAQTDTNDHFEDAEAQTVEGLGDGALGLTQALEPDAAVALAESPGVELGVVEKVAWSESGSPEYYVRHSDASLLEAFRHKWYADGEVVGIDDMNADMDAVTENVKSEPQTFDTEFMTRDLAGGINRPKRQRLMPGSGDNPLAAERHDRLHGGKPAAGGQSRKSAPEHPSKTQFSKWCERWMS